MSQSYKISLCMIVRNAETTLARCLDSIKDYVDEICITDTGSTDKTKEIAAKYTDKIFDFPWVNDFSAARNFSFSKATHDIILWLDADDVVEHADQIRAVVEAGFVNPQLSVIFFKYNYEFNKDGHIVCVHWRERLVRKDAFIWKGRVHETFIPVGQYAGAKDTSVVINHHHQGKNIQESHERNLKLLELSIIDEPNDPRTMYYMGSTLMGLNKLDRAIHWFEKYIKVSGWDEEKYFAIHRLTQIHIKQNNFEKAEETALKGISIKPNSKECYFDLGYVKYRTKDLEGAIEWIERGKKLPLPNTLLVYNPLEYTYNQDIILSDCYVRTGRLVEAIDCYDRLLEVSPDDPQIIGSRNFTIQLHSVQDCATGLIKATEFCLQNEELIHAEQLVDAAPIEIRDYEPFKLQQARVKRIAKRIHDVDSGIRSIDPCMNLEMKADLKQEKKYIALLSYLGQLKSEIRTILDFGTFNGWYANNLQHLGFQCTGVDIEDRGIAFARGDAEKFKLGTKFAKCTYKKLSDKFFREFDSVVCFDVLEHVLEPELLIKNLEQACKEDGWIFLNVPDGAWHKGNMDTQKEEIWEHVHSYEYRDIIRLFAGRKNLAITKLPSGSLRSPSQGSLFISYQNRKQPGKTIEIVCCQTPEPWTPDSVKSGIGGSEEAVINVAKELHKLGHTVTVYNTCEEKEGIYDGIPYVNSIAFDPYIKHDVIIAWRFPSMFQLPIEANEKYLWLHDVPNPLQYTKELVDQIDKVFVLSKFHGKCLEGVVPDHKLYYTRNGVDVSYFNQHKDVVIRNSHKLIYSSSPDRGLDKLLEIFPEIRKAVPDAELHIFYGWGVFDQLRTSYDQVSWKASICEKMKQPGITYHGRVGHEDLAKELLSSGVWAYPTYFPEISCITAMKAQIAGAIPVCTDFAALSETVKYGYKLPGSSNDPMVLEAFKNKLIEVLSSEQESLRRDMMEHSGNYYSWATVVQEWDKDVLGSKVKSLKR